jgi:hypothetical protein
LSGQLSDLIGVGVGHKLTAISKCYLLEDGFGDQLAKNID